MVVVARMRRKRRRRRLHCPHVGRSLNGRKKGWHLARLAARNVGGQVVMYADGVTDSMQRALSETNRRRQLQLAYNDEHGIDPQTIRKAVTDILAIIRPVEETAPIPGESARSRSQDAHRRLVDSGVDRLGYLEGEALLGDDRDDTTDGSHPNDLGFFRQANAIEKSLKDLGI